MDSTRTLRRLLVVGVAVVFGSVTTVVLATAPEDVHDRPASSSRAVATYSHDELRGDAAMTQWMSTPNARNDFQYHRSDGQLERSQNAAYVAALEQHQAAIDMMLARGTP